MAGYSLTDLLKYLPGNEETGLKQVIAQAWETMKKTNWDDTKFCTINPSIVMTFPMAKNFQAFYNNEGWFVVIKRKDRNYHFDIYNLN